MGPDRTWSPGTIKLLQDEVVRLADIAEMLDELAADLRSVAPEGWAGRAADAYGELRDEVVKRCQTGAAAYEAAASAAEDYVRILAELGRRRRYETASDALARLEQQRVEAAERLETAWREATDEFEAIRTALPVAVPVAVPVAAAAPAEPRFGDPRYVQDLSDAVLDFFARRA
ncbi:hypothetical protein [Amycolatopsis sp. NPDC021455]|uniref:hypothetical protein n=1 Tax=Amycolatopsis sp. NPDC021455 TaxID=3154901 RepID=UPI0033C5D484